MILRILAASLFASSTLSIGVAQVQVQQAPQIVAGQGMAVSTDGSGNIVVSSAVDPATLEPKAALPTDVPPLVPNTFANATCTNCKMSLTSDSTLGGSSFVTSVAGRTGAISLTHSDLSDFATSVAAQIAANAPGFLTSSVAASTYATVAQASNLGMFTVASLPSCTSANYGKLAYVSDLGGGANNVKCIAGSWQHLTLGTPQTASGSAITITPLSSAPIQLIPSGVTGINIAGTPYPSEPLYLVMPTLLGGALTSVGLTVNNVNSGISLLPGKTYFLVANASGQMVQVQ